VPSNLTTQLKELLGSSSVEPCLIATIVPRFGAPIIRVSSHHERFEFPPSSGIFYDPDHGLRLALIKSGLGSGVDNTEVVGHLDNSQFIETDIDSGALIGVPFEISLISLSNLNAGQKVLMSGDLGDFSITDGVFQVSMRSISARLKIATGRLTSKKCTCFRLGDPECGVNIGSGTVPGRGGRAVSSIRSVSSIITSRRVFRCSPESAPGGFYSLGHVQFLTGANAGRTIGITTHTLISGNFAEVTLEEPAVFDIQVGDSVRLIAGCNKKLKYLDVSEPRVGNTCAEFGNQANYRGQFLLPGEERIKQVLELPAQSSGGGK